MAVFKLNVYDRGKIIKTLQTNSYEMSYGTFEDLMQFAEYTGSKEDAAKVVRFMKPFLFEIFPDATDDDLRKARRSDVMTLMRSAMAYGKSEVNEGAEKNQAGAQD